MLLNIENVSFSYSTKLVFENINCKLNDKEILCIIGPNGCGKTTLLDCVLGIHKVHKGNILLLNSDINKYSRRSLGKKISYVSQLNNESFSYKVSDIVVMGRAAYKTMFQTPDDIDMKIVDKVLNKLNIIHLRDKYFNELSGGERQLVYIARAIAQETDIIVMDEPTASLDYRNEVMIIKMIMQLINSESTSIIMATHFPNHPLWIANAGFDVKVLMIKDNKQFAYGKAQEILNEKNINQLYSIDSTVVENGTSKVIIPVI